jgi:hypothetical protein
VVQEEEEEEEQGPHPSPLEYIHIELQRENDPMLNANWCCTRIQPNESNNSTV